MKQGWESRSTAARALSCVIVAIGFAGMLAPAMAWSQAASGEYDQLNLPNAGGSDGGSSGGSSSTITTIGT